METITAVAGEPASIDVAPLAEQLHLSVPQIRATIRLLDEGNTIPFITRYRRDQTGGLDEQQIRTVQLAIRRERQLQERREKVLTAIRAQGKLTEDLERRILGVRTLKDLESLYLPYRVKKQTLAAQARRKGLEPLATAVLAGELDEAALQQNLAAHVDPDKGLADVGAVLQGVRHLLAEHFHEQISLRQLVRKHLEKGELVSKRIELADSVEGEDQAAESSPDRSSSTDVSPQAAPRSGAPESRGKCLSLFVVRSLTTANTPWEVAAQVLLQREASAVQRKVAKQRVTKSSKAVLTAEQRRQQRRDARHKKRQKLEQSFQRYFDYREPLAKVPDYRILAINRGERCKVLRVRIDADQEPLRSEAERQMLADEHPQRDLLRESLHDALARLIVPGMEREIRRELTERAEQHAVEVFAENLRKLLLQPPLQQRRILAIDPGFRSGCKVVALDEHGNVLAHTLVHVIGAAERVEQSRQRLADMIREHKIQVVALGNGTACRETERLVAKVLTKDLPERDVRYLIVNEAGASVYSTSQIGREELPKHDPLVRGADRHLGPTAELSELVKIDPANIGVGLYQHDVKNKHLQESLEEVVQSCVNYVGVDLNSASPSLLSRVSGLNKLTARRIYQYRQQHGPFRSREQLKQVPGIGETTFVQAAGFLRIAHGDNPLDATWIHPESYPVAEQILKIAGCDLEMLKRPVTKVGEGQAVADASQSATAGASEPDPAAASSATQAPCGQDVPGEASTGEASTGEASTGQAITEEVSAEEPFAQRMAKVDVDQLAEQLQVGEYLIRDILQSLARPGRDPRADLPPPAFRRETLKLEELKPGTQLSATVLNVVDFGAFVDIGLGESGLVHVSRLANRFIADPHEIVSVGDVMTVWVVDVDTAKRRVSLTALPPGTSRPRRHQGQTRGRGGGAQSSGGQSSGGQSSGTRDGKGAGGRRGADGRGSRGTGGRGQGGRGRTGQRSDRAQGQSRTARPPHRRKPAKPITDAMAEGKEPMRTFSDLQQFFQQQREQKKSRKKPRKTQGQSMEKSADELSVKPVEGPEDKPPEGIEGTLAEGAEDKLAESQDRKPTDKLTERPTDKGEAGPGDQVSDSNQ